MLCIRCLNNSSESEIILRFQKYSFPILFSQNSLKFTSYITVAQLSELLITILLFLDTLYSNFIPVSFKSFFCSGINTGFHFAFSCLGLDFLLLIQSGCVFLGKIKIQPFFCLTRRDMINNQ